MMPKETKIALLLCLFVSLILLAACNNSPDNPLESTEWNLESISGRRLPEGFVITLAFGENIAQSRSVCNNYSAGYGFLKEGHIFITPKNLSNRVCFDPPEVMDTELAYIAVLSEVSRYEQREGYLQLSTDKGDVLIFVEAP